MRPAMAVYMYVRLTAVVCVDVLARSLSGVDFEVVVDVKDSKDTRVQTVTVRSGGWVSMHVKEC